MAIDENLVRKVATISFEAALYLMLDVEKLPSFEYSEGRKLIATFMFDETPQGHSYWYNICQQLGECD